MRRRDKKRGHLSGAAHDAGLHGNSGRDHRGKDQREGGRPVAGAAARRRSGQRPLLVLEPRPGGRAICGPICWCSLARCWQFWPCCYCFARPIRRAGASQLRSACTPAPSSWRSSIARSSAQRRGERTHPETSRGGGGDVPYCAHAARQDRAAELGDGDEGSGRLRTWGRRLRYGFPEMTLRAGLLWWQALVTNRVT